jgi:hypothetical protein
LSVRRWVCVRSAAVCTTETKTPRVTSCQQDLRSSLAVSDYVPRGTRDLKPVECV